MAQSEPNLGNKFSLDSIWYSKFIICGEIVQLTMKRMNLEVKIQNWTCKDQGLQPTNHRQ